ncbi:hypothetical protein GpartN1_g2251.t1 [Galdieria partita]|uniref:Uncharacterized protein n=1 Tax=Galdieria partita TaxID=83374 RepID=A0A9C7PU16_9RHOD|nr:hypothetical protein GpartN1_g2251.t1 [Galdieria partita]
MNRSSQVVVVSGWAFAVLLLGCIAELAFVFLCLSYVPPSTIRAQGFLERVHLQTQFVVNSLQKKDAFEVIKLTMLSKDFWFPFFFYFVSFFLFPFIVASTIELSTPPHTYFLLTFTLWRAGLLFLFRGFDHILALEKQFDCRFVYFSSVGFFALFVIECYMKNLCAGNKVKSQ